MGSPGPFTHWGTSESSFVGSEASEEGIWSLSEVLSHDKCFDLWVVGSKEPLMIQPVQIFFNPN